MRRLVSVVIPALNEEENIPRLEQELRAELIDPDYDFEFIVIDNGSTDETRNLVLEICGRDSRWRYVRFSRNFGVEASIAAGYQLSRGDAIVVLYSDLQDPPSVIPEMLAKWREGYDVVYGVRTIRHGDPAWRNALVGIAYRVIDALADVAIPRNAGDFRLIGRPVRDALAQFRETNRYTRGLIAWLGFQQIGVPYERRSRAAGDSKAPIGALIVFMLNAVTSFSLRPLRLFTWLGFALVAASMIAVPVYVFLHIAGNPPPGLTTLIILGLLGIGVNSLGIGILGEYLGRTYAETKHRPLFVIAETSNIEVPEVSRGLVASPEESAQGDHAGDP